ncbi:sugar-binding transcriptional regulator [Nocardioides marmoribigeumensis]
MAVVARLYYVHRLRQRDIAERLGLSQARVSRVLQQAVEHGFVRTDVAVPVGLLPELEEEMERRYGLQEVHVVEVPPGTTDLAPVLGRAAAGYLVEAGISGRTVGFTSWSTTLQAMASALPDLPRSGTSHVVEMLGDLGSPALQHAAARSTQRLARVLGAEPVFLRTPGVAATPDLRRRALEDPYVRRAVELLDDLDVAFVGVGPVAVHSMLTPDDNYFSDAQLVRARVAGAVGQLDQRLLDAAGEPVVTELDDLVVGATLDQVRRAGRRVVVAGGASKLEAIAAALAGGWVDVLVVDLGTAQALATRTTDPLPTVAPAV